MDNYRALKTGYIKQTKYIYNKRIKFLRITNTGFIFVEKAMKRLSISNKDFVVSSIQAYF
ncbi:hypothetical protein EZS27_037690, partial [termite gut metagenome]